MALCVYPEEWEGREEGVIRKSSRNLPGPSSRNNTPASGLGHLWQRCRDFSKVKLYRGILALCTTSLPATYNFPVNSMDLITKLGGNGYPAYK